MRLSFTKPHCAAIAMSSLLSVAQVSHAAGYVYSNLNFPFSGIVVQGVRGINANGEAVGNSFNPPNGGRQTAYLYNGAGFTTLNVPSSNVTYAMGLNNSGEVVGYFDTYTASYATLQQGFLYTGGSYTILPVSEADGINNSNEIVGNSANGAFIDNGGVFTYLNYPNAIPGGTNAYGINDNGEVVGTFVDAVGNHGFTYYNGIFTPFDAPNAAPGATQAYGVNNSGEVAGTFQDAHGVSHGFLDNGGNFITLNCPFSQSSFTAPSGSGSTYAYGINAAGAIVGAYQGADRQYGYKAVLSAVPLPAAFWQLGSAFAAFGGFSRRKCLLRRN
jgi:probable HAF family extracellular repeat protein